MPKELLSKLKQNLKSRQVRNPQQEQTPLREQNLSPNLLLPVENEHLFVRARPKIVRVVSWTVYIVSSIFLLLLIVNFILDKNLEKLSVERDLLIEEGSSLELIAADAESVNRASRLYNDYKSTDTKFFPALKDISKVLQETVNLVNFTYRLDQKRMILFSHARNPTQYAFMISKLLEISQVEDITITKVELTRGVVKDYIAVIEVKLK